MESMACETPIIATDVGANPYLVVDGKSGFLIQPNDPKSLAQKIKLALENPTLIGQITETAFNEIKAYDKDIIGDSYKAVVKNLING